MKCYVLSECAVFLDTTKFKIQVLEDFIHESEYVKKAKQNLVTMAPAKIHDKLKELDFARCAWQERHLVKKIQKLGESTCYFK